MKITLSRWPIFARRSNLIILIVAAIFGVAIRLLEPWANAYFPNAEAGAVARAIAGGRGFSDAFFPGQGPTAHLLPVAPAIGALFYKVLGGGGTGQLALALWAIGITGACFILAALCLRLVGASTRVAVLAFAFLAMVPIHSFTEAIRWQVWDGGLGTMLGLATLAIVLIGEGETPPRYFIAIRAALCGATFIVNPIAGLAAICVCGLSMLRHFRRDGLVMPVLALALSMAAVLAPWTIRNYIVMGHPILLRDNLGLELALANYPGFVAPADPKKAFQDRLAQIHPNGGGARARTMLEAGGEYNYSQKLLTSTATWMRTNPDSTAAIWRRHLSEVIFPRPWMFEVEHENLVHYRAVVAAIVSVLGMAALMSAVFRRSWKYLYIMAFVAVPVLLTLPFQPVARYCWMIYPLLGALSVDAVTRGFLAVRSVRGGAWTRNLAVKEAN